MKIGFKLGLSKGGPAIFMARLKEALKKNNLVKTSFFFRPNHRFNINTKYSKKYLEKTLCS